MNIKDKLLQESKTLEEKVQLDDIFESVDLSDDVKEKFSSVYESAVKSRSVKLAEKHIEEIVEKADTYLAEQVEEIKEEQSNQVNEYLSYVVENWLTENKLAVETGLKAQLFDSLLGEMKNLFIEHNVTVPEDSVDVVEELENELAENSVELDNLIKTKARLEEDLAGQKRGYAIDKATADLTESQKENVKELAENLTLDESFESKLSNIVSMVAEKSDDKDDDKKDKDSEEGEEKDDDKGEKKPVKESDSGLNYNSNEKPSENLTEEEMKRRSFAKMSSRL